MELTRQSLIDRMSSKITSIEEFNYDNLTAPPLMSLLTDYDIYRLYKIATSIKYSGNPRLKYKAIDDIMKPRGFVKLSAGTNRVVYRHLESTNFVVKVAVDAIGIGDNPREFKNQFIFKPFVTKVFEVSPCGTVGLFERVNPITSREEFLSIADNVYEAITKWFIGKYIMADIGTKFFMNWGVRHYNSFKTGSASFGPVLLDFPYVYELDGNKLYCKAINSNGHICGGLIDYDDGFNFLYCSECGARYRVRELAKQNDNLILVNEGKKVRKTNMKIRQFINGVPVAKEESIATVGDFMPEAVACVKKTEVSVPTEGLRVKKPSEFYSPAPIAQPKAEPIIRGIVKAPTATSEESEMVDVYREVIAEKEAVAAKADADIKADIMITNPDGGVFRDEVEREFIDEERDAESEAIIEGDDEVDPNEPYTFKEYDAENEIIFLEKNGNIISVEKDEVLIDEIVDEIVENSPYAEQASAATIIANNIKIELESTKQLLESKDSEITSLENLVKDLKAQIEELEKSKDEANNEVRQIPATNAITIFNHNPVEINQDEYGDAEVLTGIVDNIKFYASPSVDRDRNVIVLPCYNKETGDDEFLTNAAGSIIVIGTINGHHIDDIIKAINFIEVNEENDDENDEEIEEATEEE